jgi:hypothetical protein
MKTALAGAAAGHGISHGDSRSLVARADALLREAGRIG